MYKQLQVTKLAGRKLTGRPLKSDSELAMHERIRLTSPGLFLLFVVLLFSFLEPLSRVTSSRKSIE